MIHEFFFVTYPLYDFDDIKVVKAPMDRLEEAMALIGLDPAITEITKVQSGPSWNNPHDMITFVTYYGFT